MYKCEMCKKVVSLRVRCYKLVEQTRNKEYPSKTIKKDGDVRGKTRDYIKTRDRHDDNGGHGWEIVREINCCPNCYAKSQEGEDIES